MAETLNWNASVSVNNGPSLKVGANLSVDAYSKLHITLDAAAGTVQQVVLAGTDSAVALLFIRANQYGDPAAADSALLYRVNDAPEGDNAIMDGPLFLVGASAVSLLDDSGVQSITFTNNTGSAVILDILLGTDVTPTP
jgi:hypothetical protein